MNKTVSFCAKHSLCCSCGFCSDICPKGAIQIKNRKGIFIPSVEKTKCSKCGLCYEVCSGKGNDWYNQSFKLNNDIEDSYLKNVGLYRKAYISHAVDYDVRFHGASGGTVSALLIYMLEKRIIDGAIVTQFKKDNPLEVETIIATTKDEILNAKSSKYCPVHMDGILSRLKTFEGKVAIVGLPCHLQTIRKIEEKIKWVKEKIIFHIGLLCSGSKDSNALNYLLVANGFNCEGIIKFSYRDDGCLGNVKVSYEDETKVVPFVQAYNKLHSYFKPERCLSCIDHFAYLSDISIGDIDCEPYNKDKIGSNSVIIRSKLAQRIFDDIADEKQINREIIDISEVIRSQRVLTYRNKTYIANKFLSRLFFKPTVKYDREVKEKLSLKGLIWVISYKIQRVFSKLGLKK